MSMPSGLILCSDKAGPLFLTVKLFIEMYILSDLPPLKKKNRGFCVPYWRDLLPADRFSAPEALLVSGETPERWMVGRNQVTYLNSRAYYFLRARGFQLL